jgi:hypothetical protein
MKLRLQGNSLRLRLTRSEVARLHEHGAAEETVPFSTGSRLTYCVRERADADAVQADLCNGVITVHVPAEAILSWATSDEVGLYGQDGPLRIAVEKDFRCLTRPKDEESPDVYPHPAEQSTS